MSGMDWGSVELEPEVERWLADRGVHLSEPYTKQLRGKLRELRFFVGRQRSRVTYFITERRRIILLTVFPKTRPQERHEVARAERARKTCLAEGHTTEEDTP